VTDDIEVYCNTTATFQVSDLDVISPEEELGDGLFEEEIMRALRDRLMADLTSCFESFKGAGHDE
jgi:hypothetical protein